VISHDREIAWSESSDQEIVEAANELDGLLLTRVDVNLVMRTSGFEFERNTRIETWPYEEDDSEQRMLFMRSGEVLNYRADGLFSVGPSNQTIDEQRWLRVL
jgi:hypothetical protein